MEAPSATNSRLPVPRRVATEPPPLQPLRRSLSVSSTTSRTGLLGTPKSSDESIETLYSHPSAKIIAFNSSQRFSSAGSDFLSEPKPGSLAASSHLERTIAVGPFRIYRAPGSVAFLNCGSALQPILPKSQCWCLDEANSSFVLQIRRPQYWRIEVPLSDAEDAHRARVLREVFDSILLFEKTECPFQRSFTVRLPERPQTPVKKKPWTPIGKNLISSPFLSEVSPPVPATELVNKRRRARSSVKTPETQAEAEEHKGQTSQARARSIAGQTDWSDSSPKVDQVPTVGATDTKAVERSEATTVEEEPVEENAVKLELAHEERQNTLGVPGYNANPDVQEEPIPQHSTRNGSQASNESVPDSGLLAIVVEDDETTEPASTPTVTPELELRDSGTTQQTTQQMPETVRYNSESTTPLIPVEKPVIQMEMEARHAGLLPDISDTDLAVPIHKPNVDTSLVYDSATVPMPSRVSVENSPIRAKSSGTVVDGETSHQTAQWDVTAKSAHATTLLQTITPPTQQDDKSKEPCPILPNEKIVAASEVPEDTGKDEPNSFEGSGSVGAISLKKKRMSRMLAGRSVSLPPQLTLVTSPPSTYTPRLATEQPPTTSSPLRESSKPLVEEASPIESVDSFHSVQSWHSPITPLPPSPPSSSASPALFPYPHENIILPAKGLRTVRSANFTPITEETLVSSPAGATVHAYDIESPADSLSPFKDSKASSSNFLQPISSTAPPERPELKRRSRTTNLSISRRALSPLPPPANLFSPTLQRRPANRLEVVRNLPSAIINKTVEILLSPPGHLVNLMLKVAAKIAAGEWRGLVFGMGEGGESIPVHWDYSDGELSSWEDDDDYKFSIGRLTKTRSNSSSASKEYADRQSDPTLPKAENDRSWEVD